MDWKHDLYEKIAPHIGDNTVLASNTSGLSITELSSALPNSLQSRFCGIHFFNPPRYMYLVELIPTAETDPAILDRLESISVSVFGKGVIRAKDTPNFVANRIGVGGSIAIIAQAEKFGLTADIVDDLTGKRIGRASSATFRTADIVGLDTLSHVLKTMQDNLESDPFYPLYKPPAGIATLVEKGLIGQKAGGGFFKKVKRDILRFDFDTGEYVPAGAKADPEVTAMLKLPAPERLKKLRESEHPQAQFVWAVLRDSFHYAAMHLEEIAHSARDIDLAMRWGFAYAQGPFELWQEAGWKEVASWIQEDIDAGEALCNASLPDWVFNGSVAENGIHTDQGSWSPATKSYVQRSGLAVYDRQIFPEDVRGSGAQNPLTSGTELFSNDSVRVWTLDHEILILSITSKMHILSGEVVQGIDKAISLAESSFKGMVIWSPDDVFSAGANLQEVLVIKAQSSADAVSELIDGLQSTFLVVNFQFIVLVEL